MEECACLCGLGCSGGCRCPQECQGPAETAAAYGKQCCQECQGPAEKAVAEAPAEKHVEADGAAWCCAGGGGIGSPMPSPHCSLQDLPVELLLEIFASLPGTDLPSLARACARFHRLLLTDSIWRRRCREEFGLRENLQNLETTGMSYREVYARLFPCRHLLGLWQLEASPRRLLNVVADGLCITGWTHRPSLRTHVCGPMHFEPSFRIRLTEGRSARVEYMDNLYSFHYSRHMQVQKDRLSIQWVRRDHRQDSPARLRGERAQVLPEEDRRLCDCLTSHRRVGLSPEDRQPSRCLTYRRLYLPPGHPDDPIRPGLFHGKCDAFGLTIAVLSFHGTCARLTDITGDSMGTLEIHLLRRIHLPDGEIFRHVDQLSRLVQEIDEQVIREQQQQQQQENGTEESEGHGWQSPAQPSVGESGPAAWEEQPVPFVLPVGLGSRDQSYPRTCRMCFYGVSMGALDPFACPRRLPGVFILFDENHLGFIGLETKYFILFGRVQNTFQNVEAPSPQAFLEMLSNIQSGPPWEEQLACTLKI